MDPIVKPFLGVIEREKWEALPPRKDLVPLEHPVANVIFTYNTDTEPCLDKDSCKKTLRDLQKRFMDQGLADLPYNFLVGGDLNVYEGRGWKFKPSKHEKFAEVHDSCIEVAFIGDYRVDNYPLSMGIKGSQLVNTGVHSNLVHPRHDMLESGKELDLDAFFNNMEFEPVTSPH